MSITIDTDIQVVMGQGGVVIIEIQLCLTVKCQNASHYLINLANFLSDVVLN